MKKALIITYYWIPSGGSGVQRWVKFVKYLRDFGWEPVIYAPENADYPVIDASFEDDVPADITVIRHPIWEPYALYRKFTGKKDKAIQTGFVTDAKQESWKDKLSVWLRGNLFIPDPRVCWVGTSVRFLKKYLKANPVDVIITTGPPHSVHLIGRRLKKQFPALPWVADFRDPWTGIFYYKDLRLSLPADLRHRQLEKITIAEADLTLVVSAHMQREFTHHHQQHKQIAVVANGYDEEDFKQEAVEPDEQFVITHTGLLTEKQNPQVLWKVLQEIAAENTEFRKDLRIRLTGSVDGSVLNDIRSKDLDANLELSAYVPHHEAIKLQRRSQLLLLCLVQNPDTKSIVTGKLFEYLQADRPVIGIGYTDGDAATILKQTNAGVMFDFADAALLKEKVLDFYQQYKTGKLCAASDKDAISQFSRRKLTEKLTVLLDGLL
ncbi:hypothetical protein SDC9_37198 [bioreactor metagenome]|jgi:hypothetical protein|uniref:Glycosyltransferase subfamily 4-like N-terminal domain-containing protein n=1 Tax=bioreactor metagenome TaxID=1076179 RepID=A0A644VIS7_9ZZZZ|nr:glycosyltransferase [Paludibacter sp.]